MTVTRVYAKLAIKSGSVVYVVLALETGNFQESRARKCLGFQEPWALPCSVYTDVNSVLFENSIICHNKTLKIPLMTWKSHVKALLPQCLTSQRLMGDGTRDFNYRPVISLSHGKQCLWWTYGKWVPANTLLEVCTGNRVLMSAHGVFFVWVEQGQSRKEMQKKRDISIYVTDGSWWTKDLW